MYVFSGTDPEYHDNLRYFIREGMQEDDGCDYYIVLQRGEGLIEIGELPLLPTNAQTINHPNECFDLGTVGWLLDDQIVDVSKYKFFIWLNSSVRGPFLPAYMKGVMHWTQAFTNKLTDVVKLVGATINCGGAYEMPATPHVQTYVVATDRTGLMVLRNKRTVLNCWSNIGETVMHSELGASKAIIEAGYNLDCLMLRYQGLDWRDSRASACNANFNPVQQSFYDGINVDPLEVLFIKVKDSMKAAGWGHVAQAVKYDEWEQQQRQNPPPSAEARYAEVATNEWTQLAPRRIAEANRHGSACFDHEFYVSANRFDLGWIMMQPDPPNVAWGHFINSGILEGRPHRFTC
ncbi:hypothetical protein WJX72_005006 [[Myrmecia] bisecta]|uniref:Uncharacterized protein n=1 Tax=[Myrmecia] bisecta TaxID=41462 RepID=A0AAW1QBV0_9CHLO